MISLLGSLLGFGSSLIGPVLEAWNKSSDQKHELAMLHAQAEIQSKIQDQMLEATIVEWLAINWAVAWLIIDEEGITVYNLRAILDTDFMGLVSCVIAFWFGNRTFGKRKT